MNITLTQSVRIAGVEQAAGTKLTVSDDIGKDLINRNAAVDDNPRFEPVPVMATKDVTGGIELSAGGVSLNVPNRAAIEVRKDALTESATWSNHFKLFSNSDFSLESVYWPWVIRADQHIANPLGKYYMYISTDHGTGGIWLLYADKITGPWNMHGKVFEDVESADKGETPSLMWDSTISKYRMFYHSSFAKYGAAGATSALGGQSTLSATSANGITWVKDPNFILDIPAAGAVRGDGHTGYFLPYQTKNGWVGTSLYGSGNGPEWVQWRMGIDSAKWTTDSINLGYSFQWTAGAQFANFPRFERIHSFVVQSGGVEYIVGMLTNGVSGSAGKNACLFVAPISPNYRDLTAAPSIIWLPTEAWESSNIRAITPFVEDGILYVMYSMNKTAIGVIAHVL